jgi:hypothetical protein
MCIRFSIQGTFFANSVKHQTGVAPLYCWIGYSHSIRSQFTIIVIANSKTKSAAVQGPMGATETTEITHAGATSSNSIVASPKPMTDRNDTVASQDDEARTTIEEPNGSSPVEAGDEPAAQMPLQFDGSWDDWSKRRFNLGQESNSEYRGADEKLRLAVSHLAIEIAYRPDHDWKAEALDASLSVPNSKHAYMAATVATFGDNAIGEKAKKDLAVFLDRTALAVEALVRLVAADPAAYPVSAVGIDGVMSHIDVQGGLTKLAAEQRKINAEKKKPRKVREAQIALDPEMSREVHLERAREVVYGNASAADVQLAFVTGDDSAPTVCATIPASETQIDSLLMNVEVVDPVIGQVGELLEAGQMVAEEDTDQLKDELDDPENPDKGVRVGYRQIVFEDDMPIVISPILTSSAVIVLAEPIDPIFLRPLGKRCHFRTRERRIMEANIADPKRRDAFQAEWEDAGVTNGVIRLVVTTPAASDEADIGRNVGCLVEPLHSAQGNLPLTVHSERFKPQFEGEVSFRTWRTRQNEFILRAAKGNGKQATAKQEHRFSADSWKIAAGKKNDERDAGGTGASVCNQFSVN